MKTIQKKNILLSGRPGVGKTTLIRRLASSFQGIRIGGFYTEEIRNGSGRTGFRIKTFEGRSGILSGLDVDGPRVGKYGVNLRDLEEIGVESLRQTVKTAGIILVDEIGKMELLSVRFRDAVTKCLDSGIPVIATILNAAHPDADRIKARGDCRVIEVTERNRDSLPRELTRISLANRDSLLAKWIEPMIKE